MSDSDHEELYDQEPVFDNQPILKDSLQQSVQQSMKPKPTQSVAA